MSASQGQMPREHEEQPAEPRSRRETTRRVTLVVIAVLATLFAVLNVDEVKVHWIIGSGNAPLIIVIVISILAGIVLTYSAERIARKRR
jgi:uncharacterized integral membrane protein